MSARVWILLALAAVALLGTRAPVFHDSGAQSKSVNDVFATILRQQYAGWSGYRTCVTSPEPNHDICWAELHRGNRYRQVEVGIDLSPSQPVPSAATPHSIWTRGPMPINTPAGSGIANTREYAWDYLMRTVPETRLPTSVFDVNGDTTGYPAVMFTFSCTGTPKKVTCRNALGDSITYKPHGLQSY